MRTRSFRLRTMLILVAAVALALAGSRRWMADPTASRLGVGSEALIDPESRGQLAVYSRIGARPVLVPNGSRVRVISDGQRSQIVTYLDADGTRTLREDRDVRITVLDGKRAGFTGFTARSFLRPAP